MRHSDCRTTLNHDTWLGLSDTAGAINQLPDIGGTHRNELKATGTMDAAPVGGPQQYSQQLGRKPAQVRSGLRDDDDSGASDDEEHKDRENTRFCDQTHDSATIRDDPAGVAQLVERQLPKLNVEGSSPFARFGA